MPWDVENLITSVIVSALVTWFSGDRWVDINNRRREHSLTIANESIQGWIEMIDIIAPRGTKLNNVNDVIGKYPKNLDLLPYNEDLEKHLETGYPEIIEKWDKYTKSVKEYNDDLANVQEDIHHGIQLFLSTKGIDVFYPAIKRHRPILAINPWDLIITITQEFESILDGYEPWHFGEPSVQDATSGDLHFFNLSFRGRLIISDPNFEIISELRDFVRISIESKLLYDGMLRIYEKKKRVDGDSLDFSNTLSRIIEEVKLGNNLKGKCTTCIPRWQI